MISLPGISNDIFMNNLNDESLKDRSGNRRDFILKTSLAGLALSGLPQVASVIWGSSLHAREIIKSEAITKGKAQHLTLLHTADIHAQLYTHDEFFWEDNQAVYKKRGGLAVLKTMLYALKAQNPENTLIIDGGDCFQGGGVASLSLGQAIIPLINNIGYDIVLPGNWEVVYGKEMMRKDLGAYTANKICANMWYRKKDNSIGDLLFPPYWTKIIAGVKIGFIGYNDPLTAKRQSPDYSKGILFTHPELNVAQYIRKLKNDEKCQLIFLVTHMGLAQQIDLANQSCVDGISYILGADTHERVRTPVDGKYAKVTEPGSFGSFVAKLDIVLEDGKIKDQNYELLDVDPEKFLADPEMSALVIRAREPYKKKLDEVLGKTNTPLMRYFVMETPMDNMITDAIMWKSKPDIALSNGFRFCPPLVPDPVTGFADITDEFLWSMLPVDSEAKSGKITGEQLLLWLENEMKNVFSDNPAELFGGWMVRFSGMQINITARNPNGKRVNAVTINNKPLEINKVYRIVACEREGDPDNILCRVENVQNTKRLGITLHQILKEYLKTHSPVSPKLEGRVVATDEDKFLLTQVKRNDYQFR
jgi:sulfur-oxidizing protein SoxB